MAERPTIASSGNDDDEAGKGAVGDHSTVAREPLTPPHLSLVLCPSLGVTLSLSVSQMFPRLSAATVTLGQGRISMGSGNAMVWTIASVGINPVVGQEGNLQP